MYLLDRQKKILTLLISGNGWITGEKIGSALGITDRTVRNDIRIINEELQEYTDSVIESIRGKGYFLVSKERNILLEKLEKTDVGETTEGRLYSIALEILMTQDPIPLDDLEEEFYISIAAHLGAALERLETQKVKSDFKIAVCSNMSTGVVSLLMAKLYSLYMNGVEISGPYPVHDMGKMIKGKPSLILTTTSANLFKHTSLPVITIMPTLEAEDVLAINQEISRLKREKVVFGLPDGIEKYFEEELYFPQIELENRESVLEYLCNKIVQKGYASEELFANTLEREKIAPTAFANQIAMPHPMRSCAYKTVIAVATLKKPIFWGNLNVRLVFLLVVRGSDMRYMNSFFDLTAKLVWEKKKIKKLLSLSQFEEFIEELV